MDYTIFYGVLISISELLNFKEVIEEQYEKFVDPCDKYAWQGYLASLCLEDKLANQLSFILRPELGYGNWFLARNNPSKIDYICIPFSFYTDRVKLTDLASFSQDVKNLPARFVQAFNAKIFRTLKFLGEDFAKLQICKGYIFCEGENEWIECNEQGNPL